MKEKMIKKYAEFLVKVGLNLQKGEKLKLTFSIDAINLAREIVEQAYSVGVVDVKTILSDDEINNKRFIYGSDEACSNFGDYDVDYADRLITEGYHNLYITSYSNPNKDVDVEKLTKYSVTRAKAMKEVSKRVSANEIKWCIAPYVSKDWAKLMYPELQICEAEDKLLKNLFEITRMSYENPIQEWKNHIKELKYRLDLLNNYNFESLHFFDDETNVVIYLADGARWCGGSEFYKDGNEFIANIPTEEVFTMPHKNKVNGHVKIRKPFVWLGKEINGIELDFVDGKVVNFKTDDHQELFRDMLNFDEGASRLGEVALVDKSSPINKFEKAFFNTLLDENAACHIALGAAYDDTTSSTLSDKNKIGWNESSIHEDIMLGSETLTVIGKTYDGIEVTIMKDGGFTDEFRLKE